MITFESHLLSQLFNGLEMEPTPLDKLLDAKYYHYSRPNTFVQVFLLYIRLKLSVFQ